MCYKQETQNKNAEKIKRKLDEDKVPEFIRRYFIRIDSQLGAINYWVAIKDLLLWLIDQSVIKKDCLANLTPDDFCDVEAEDIKLYLKAKEKVDISKTTLYTRKNIFASFWSYLVDTNKCPVKKNIIHSVKYKVRASKNNLIRKLPSEERLAQIEKNIMKKNDKFVRLRNLCILKVLKGTDVRECELAGLDLDDLFLEENDYKNVGENLPCIRIVGKGANNKRESRMVYITGSAVSAIKEWLIYRGQKVNIIDQNALFLTKNGKRFNEKDIQGMFKTYGGGITPHMIRHWVATMLANNGHAVFAQQQFGHVSEETTINHYINAIDSMKDILANM